MADRRWLRTPYIFDGLLALVWFGVVIGHLVYPDSGWDQNPELYRPYNALAVVLTTGVWLPVIWRRRFPITVFSITWCSVLALVLGDFMVATLPVICWILMFTVGAYAARRRVIATVLGATAALAIAQLSHYPDFGFLDTVRNAAILAGLALAGQFIQANRQAAAARLELAERRAALEAEKARSTVIEERLRLARELHDVVAHSLSVMAVQAEVGMATVDSEPAKARTALTNISRTSHETLNELRLMLGVLRSEDDDAKPLSPTPTIDDIPKLIERVEATGLDVDLHVDGDTTALPSSIGLFVYRVIQESLTNVIKHARARSVDVSVEVRPDKLELKVRDDGRGAAALHPSPDGRGLVGMRERAAAHGGLLTAGPANGGGFEVAVSVPLVAA